MSLRLLLALLLAVVTLSASLWSMADQFSRSDFGLDQPIDLPGNPKSSQPRHR